MSFRTDVIKLDEITKTDEGYLFSDARVTKAGVFRYLNADGTERFEFRSPAEVFKQDSLNTLQRKPLSNNHPAGGVIVASNAKSLSVGFSGENVRKDGLFVRVPITITDASAVSDVESGKRELSCGYHCDVEPQTGEFEGQKYTHVQKNIRYNHIAIVHKGRAGSDVRIDEMDNMFNTDEIDPLEMIRMNIHRQDSFPARENRADENFDPQEFIRQNMQRGR